MGILNMDTGVDRPTEISLRNELIDTIERFVADNDLTYMELYGVLDSVKFKYLCDGNYITPCEQ